MSARKPKMGRPPVAKDKAKSALLSVRFSEDERATLERAAREAGLSLSQWARASLLAQAKGR